MALKYDTSEIGIKIFCNESRWFTTHWQRVSSAKFDATGMKGLVYLVGFGEGDELWEHVSAGHVEEGFVVQVVRVLLVEPVGPEVSSRERREA